MSISISLLCGLGHFGFLQRSRFKHGTRKGKPEELGAANGTHHSGLWEAWILCPHLRTSWLGRRAGNLSACVVEQPGGVLTGGSFKGYWPPHSETEVQQTLPKIHLSTL